MPNIQQRKFVRNTDVAATDITSTPPSPTVVTDGFPVGDLLYKKINLRLDGTLSLSSATGVIVPRGGLAFLESLRFETDKHGILVDNIDGIALHNVQTVRKGRRPLADDINGLGIAAPTYEYGLEVPFFDPEAIRPEDTGLDMWGARPTLTTSYGTNADFVDSLGGTVTVDVYRQEIDVTMDPGPVDVSKDGPLAMNYLGIKKEPITSTTANYAIYLPFGDRNVKRFHIYQRLGVRPYSELANTVLGAANADRISVKVNGFPWLDRVQWIALQDSNASDYRLDAMPVGAGVVDFVPKRAQGFKYSDALSLITNVNGICEIVLDVTTVTNGQLWIVTEAVKPLPPAAIRPAPTAAIK